MIALAVAGVVGFAGGGGGAAAVMMMMIGAALVVVVRDEGHVLEAAASAACTAAALFDVHCHVVVVTFAVALLKGSGRLTAGDKLIPRDWQ
jgi:hypothetical protein